jgi:hypothetical protein
MKSTLFAWVAAGVALAGTATASGIYTFDIGAYSYDGDAYQAAQFSVALANPVPVNAFETPLGGTAYDGLAVANVVAGAWNAPGNFSLSLFNDDINPANGDPYGPAGTIVGVMTPMIMNFGYQTGGLSLAPLGPTADAEFYVLIGTGCVGSPSACGTGWNEVAVRGSAYYTALVPEPTTFALFGIGLFGIGLLRRHARA